MLDTARLQNSSIGMQTAYRHRFGVPALARVGWLNPSQVGFTTISQKIASTLRNAGQPSQNQTRIVRW